MKIVQNDVKEILIVDIASIF